MITKSFGLVPHRRYIGYLNRKRGGTDAGGGVCIVMWVWFSHEFWSNAELAFMSRALVTKSTLAFGGNHEWWVLLI